MKICPMCAAQLSDEATLCPQCGSALTNTQNAVQPPADDYNSTTVLNSNNPYSAPQQPVYPVQPVQPGNSPVIDNQQGGGYQPVTNSQYSNQQPGGGYNSGAYDNSGAYNNSGYYQTGYGYGNGANTAAINNGSNNFSAKLKSIDKKYFIIGAAALAAIIVVIILITTLSSTPTKTANKYLNARFEADGEQVLESCYPNTQDFIKDYYSEDNEGISDDIDVYIENIQDIADENGYDGKIENGSDIYDYYVWQLSETLEDNDGDAVGFEIKSVKKYKKGDSKYDDIIDEVEDIVDDDDFDDFNIEKYISPDDIKQYAVVEYSTYDEDGDEVSDDLELELVKVGTKWYVFSYYFWY